MLLNGVLKHCVNTADQDRAALFNTFFTCNNITIEICHNASWSLLHTICWQTKQASVCVNVWAKRVIWSHTWPPGHLFQSSIKAWSPLSVRPHRFLEGSPPSIVLFQKDRGRTSGKSRSRYNTSKAARGPPCCDKPPDHLFCVWETDPSSDGLKSRVDII